MLNNRQSHPPHCHHHIPISLAQIHRTIDSYTVCHIWQKSRTSMLVHLPMTARESLLHDFCVVWHAWVSKNTSKHSASHYQMRKWWCFMCQISSKGPSNRITHCKSGTFISHNYSNNAFFVLRILALLLTGSLPSMASSHDFLSSSSCACNKIGWVLVRKWEKWINWLIEILSCNH